MDTENETPRSWLIFAGEEPDPGAETDVREDAIATAARIIKRRARVPYDAAYSLAEELVRLAEGNVIHEARIGDVNCHYRPAGEVVPAVAFSPSPAPAVTLTELQLEALATIDGEAMRSPNVDRFDLIVDGPLIVRSREGDDVVQTWIVTPEGDYRREDTREDRRVAETVVEGKWTARYNAVPGCPRVTVLSIEGDRARVRSDEAEPGAEEFDVDKGDLSSFEPIEQTSGSAV